MRMQHAPAAARHLFIWPGYCPPPAARRHDTDSDDTNGADDYSDDASDDHVSDADTHTMTTEMGAGTD